MSSEPRLAFIDSETVTLATGPDVLWEVAVILRNEGHDDLEWRFQMAPNLEKADPVSLSIGMFDARYEVPADVEALAWGPVDTGGAVLTHGAVAGSLHALLAGRHLVGAVPWFDTERLALYFGRFGLPASWHYHLLDVENLAVGWLRGRGRDALTLPWKSDDLSVRCGVAPPGPEDRHTALGDARWARDLYDTVMGT